MCFIGWGLIGMLLVDTSFYEDQGHVIVFIDLFVEGTLIKKIYYEFYGSVLPMKNPVNDFALIAIMPYAMEKGYNLHIKGAVHLDLLRNMEESQDAWLRWHPDLFKKISISADIELPASLSEKRNAVLAFSGGLDATYALHAHANSLLGRRSCNIIVGVFIQGFDVNLDNSEAFDDALVKNSNILNSYGISQAYVKTNWRELGASWEEAHMFGIVSVISQFSTNVDCGVIASDVAYDEEDLGWGSNAVTNALFSSPSFPLSFTGGSHSRTRKAEIVSNNPVVLQNLRVCYQGKVGNCGTCEKCIRTKLNFLAVGVPHVPSIGDPITLRKIKNLHINTKKEVDRYNRILKEGYWNGLLKEKSILERVLIYGVFKYRFFIFLKKWKRSFGKRFIYIKGKIISMKE